MKLIKEYSAANGSMLAASGSCFFHMQGEYCCLSSSDRKLYKNLNKNQVCLELADEYRKIFYHEGFQGYFACSWVKHRNEIVLHFLDQSMGEFDVLRLRAEGTGGVEDMWLDGKIGLLYLVFALSIHIYNLNGDFLGTLMKAPMDTWYKAFCSNGDRMFLAYERLGCIYVAEYDSKGVFKEKLGLGGGLSVGNMELILSSAKPHINLYGKRRGRLIVCVEVLVDNAACSDSESLDHMPCCKGNTDIIVEFSKGSGVGDTTCHISCPDD